MRLFFILIFILSVTACTVEQDKEKQGPEGSWWLGGADGGAFIKIEDDENLNDQMYLGTVYFEHDQKIWYEGPFKLIGDINFSIDKHELYLFWDGERIHLKESSYLEAVNPVPLL